MVDAALALGIDHAGLNVDLGAFGDGDDAEPTAPFEEANEIGLLRAQRAKAMDDQFVIARNRAVARLQVGTREVLGEAFAAVGEHGGNPSGQRGRVRRER